MIKLQKLCLNGNRQEFINKRFFAATSFLLRRKVEPIKIKKNDTRVTIKIKVKPQMTISELAKALNKPVDHVYNCIKQAKFNNIVLKEYYLIKNFDQISDIVKLSGFQVSLDNDNSKELLEKNKELKYLDENDEYANKRPKIKKLVKRAPIVTIMGHVDHGKTTLLDALRNANVVQTEFGGITQHIGAFNCQLKSSSDTLPRNITFLDTPGHAAFMSMRERGAKLTDIIVLVIAADDGIMEQTIESIRLAKESKCSIIVAINKIDKASPAAIQTEDTGGEIQCVHISALKKQNIELLKEEIWALAEILELKGDPTLGLVEGYVIESYHDTNRGKLATIILKRGTLNKNSYLVSGSTYCKVKQMLDDKLQPINEAILSNAVQIMGWKDLPEVGEEVLEVDSEKRAKEIVNIRLRKKEIEKENEALIEINKKKQEHYLEYQEYLTKKRAAGYRYSVKRAHSRESQKLIIDNEKNHVLSLIIKADVTGTLEAILNSLEKYQDPKVMLDIVDFGVGPITKSDYENAELFGSIIYGFNIENICPDIPTDSTKYKVKHFNIIYKLFDDIKMELDNIAPLIEKEEIIGSAELTQVFEVKDGKELISVAGGRCTNGLIDSKKFFRILRNDKIIYEKEKCKSLKHLKTSVPTIKQGSDFGFALENISIKFERGDKIICYDIKMVPGSVEWNIGF